MWYLLQSVIAGAVMIHNAYYHWTPNGYLAGLIGFGLAWLVTQGVWRLMLRREESLQRHPLRRR